VTSDDVRSFAERAEEEEQPAPAPGRPTREERRAPVQGPSLRPWAVEIPALPDFTQWGPIERKPVRSIRRAIAKKMAQSWAEIPHVSHSDEADITELEALRSRYKAQLNLESLTVTVFAMKAAVAALKEHPRFNASLDPEAQELVLKKYYHLGMAVDTERGLIVPVIRDVDRKSILELTEDLQALVTRTRNGEASLEDLQGGTFTITNVGIIGGTDFAPIINYPEVAILGMARARWRPVVQESDDGSQREIVPRLMLPLIVAFDHRVVDGADAARFLRSIVESLEKPGRLLLAI
jgi:pyruvate dehydrogenase E2 component (dihydrolipoamide acetyltransferase)